MSNEGSTQGLLDNRNGSEVLVLSEQVVPTAAEYTSRQSALPRSPRKVLTPLPKYIIDQIHRNAASPPKDAFVTRRNGTNSPTDDMLMGVDRALSLSPPAVSTPTRSDSSGDGPATRDRRSLQSNEAIRFAGYEQSYRDQGHRISASEARRQEKREDARRRDARDEARWQAERADRRAALQAAEDREDRREALRAEERRADRAQALQIAALGRAPHRLGMALEKFREFDGTDNADGAAWLTDFTKLLGTHSIPLEAREKEFFLKLKGKAARWYTTTFCTLPPGDFPPFGVMCSAFLQEYSLRYAAAEAFQAFQGFNRHPGTSGQEALQGLAELEERLRRLGVDNPGPHEQQAYRFQNLLSASELPRWISLANASDISDTALTELELHANTASLSRHSCSPETREAFFERRVAHLRGFLRDQGKAAPGSRGGGSTPARAAVVADAGSTPEQTAAIAPLALQHSPTTVSVNERARLAAVTQWNRADARDVAPPEYFGSNTDPTHLAANKASVIRRSANKSCWLCPEDKLVAGQPHWECKFHGVNALVSDSRTCPSVPGASRFGRRPPR